MNCRRISLRSRCATSSAAAAGRRGTIRTILPALYRYIARPDNQSRPAGGPGRNPSMSGPYPIRPISDSEFPAFFAVIEHAFNGTYPTEPELQHELTVFEFDRTPGRVRRLRHRGDGGAPSPSDDGPRRRRHDGRGHRGRRAALAPAARDPVQPDAPPAGRRPRPRRGGRRAVRLEASIYGRYGYGIATAELDLTIRRGEGVCWSRRGPGRTPALRGCGSPSRRTPWPSWPRSTTSRAAPGPACPPGTSAGGTTSCGIRSTAVPAAARCAA